MRCFAVRGQAVENGTLEAQVHSLAVGKALDSQRKRLIRETGLRFRPCYKGGGGMWKTERGFLGNVGIATTNPFGTCSGFSIWAISLMQHGLRLVGMRPGWRLTGNRTKASSQLASEPGSEPVPRDPVKSSGIQSCETR